MSNRAVVTGPISGGSKGRPFGHPQGGLSEYGYQETEFFLEGIATRYRPRAGSDLGRDGRWEIEPVDEAPYKTRLVVYRPVNPAAFKGTVLVSWNNVTAGFDQIGFPSPEILEAGFAFVGVSAQRAGVHGQGPMPMGLRQWDSERYGSLSIPADDYSYDIFTQAASRLAADRPATGDPLEGLDVQHLVGVGGSQSGWTLATYINAFQPLAGVFHGFLPTIHFGGGAALQPGEYLLDMADAPSIEDFGIPAQFRADSDALILVVNSEVEAIACYPLRQPDTDRFRYWEVAGTAHISAQALEARGKALQADVGMAMMIDISGLNAIPLEPVVDAAYHAMQIWLEKGTPPRSFPRIDFAGDLPTPVRDQHGIARGGIRLPQVEVPLATNSAAPSDNPVGPLGGSCLPFYQKKIRALYEDEDAFLRQFEESARAAQKLGVLLPRDVPPLVDEARNLYQHLAETSTQA